MVYYSLCKEKKGGLLLIFVNCRVIKSTQAPVPLLVFQFDFDSGGRGMQDATTAPNPTQRRQATQPDARQGKARQV